MLFPPTGALLNWMWQSTLCLGACWLLYQLLRREPYFHYNRRFLLFTPWLALLMPLLLSVAPSLTGWLPTDAAPTPLLTPSVALPALPANNSTASVSVSTPTFWLWLPLLYVAGVLLWLLWIGWQLLVLWHTARSLPHHEHADYTLALTGGKLPVSSFGQLLFWDETADLTLTEAHQVLLHELVHVRQGHTRERLLLELVRAVLWFNPFVHFYPRALALTHEYIADAVVLQAIHAPEAPTIYAALLARLTLRQRHFSLTHSFGQPQVLARIAMLHSSRVARRWKQWLLLPVSTALLTTIACEKETELSAPTIAAYPVYTHVEQMPKYKGGMQRLVQDVFWGVWYEYPAIAKAANLEGEVLVKFTVATDGTVKDVQLQKEITAIWPQQQVAARALEALAMKAVKELPGQWTPGSQSGKQVAVSYVVPFKFSDGKLHRRKQAGGPFELEPIVEYQIYSPDSSAIAFGRHPIFKDDNPVRPSPNSRNVYSQVEEMPEYAGGQGQLLTDLIRRLQYPASAKAVRLDGVAFVEFVVAEDGSVKDIRLQKGIMAPKGLEAVAEQMNQAALATLHNLPRKWKPGIQGGKEVAVSYSVPITFFLR